MFHLWQQANPLPLLKKQKSGHEAPPRAKPLQGVADRVFSFGAMRGKGVLAKKAFGAARRGFWAFGAKHCSLFYLFCIAIAGIPQNETKRGRRYGTTKKAAQNRRTHDRAGTPGHAAPP